ncbi:MAG: FAD-dependent oxidoreductase [Phenylobacterium sp.]|uniref:NAD(P)/FAD-dependent oxidoreductase n=1 Tax=Phenylobacterium sp. TaxID=1871053 RepID=UPI0027336764|nr:FAD-dependent oxidoreductase [Phenylobacterium sp.]MDP3749532.1 FAD-dependent oxidoreductase [Phenylobacterium sp.]
MPDQLLIVGGGFAGFWAALAARRVAGDRATVSVVSREPILQMRPRLYEAQPETLGVDLLPLLGAAGVQFIAGDAVGLDVSASEVRLRSGKRIGFDRLVVATGSVMRRPPVPGALLAHSIDTQDEAIALDRRLAVLCEASPATATVIVVGAGFTGIELALELRDRMAALGNAALGERMKIVLVDRALVVGSELGEGPRPVIEEALVTARVELRLGANIMSFSTNAISFADGSTLTGDAIVLTTGMVAAPFAECVPGERDSLGRLKVDTTLRAPAAPKVFVTGDAATAETGGDHATLQSCQHALQLGRFAGENAARDLLGLPGLPYEQARYVTCLDLGRSGAVLTEGWDRRVLYSGDEGKALKRRINTQVIYPPTGLSAGALIAFSGTAPDDQRPPGAT